MNKLLLIYGIIFPIMIVTSALSHTMLIAWFVIFGLLAVFHDFIFNEKTNNNYY